LGNSILLAQPTPGQIAAVLPPSDEQMSDKMIVIFTTERSDVRRATHLVVARKLYVACAQLRREVCYAFADVELGDASNLPEDGVPERLVAEAVSMPEAQWFETSFDNIAKPHDPFSKVIENVVSAEDETTLPDAAEAEDGSSARTGQAEAPAPDGEVLLWLDEANADDPLAQALLLQQGLQSWTSSTTFSTPTRPSTARRSFPTGAIMKTNCMCPSTTRT
jgi:hypothetical protein